MKTNLLYHTGMLLSSAYKKQYTRLFKEILSGCKEGIFDEAALPSYVHPTKPMARLFWKRLDIALQLAKDCSAKSVLDFGSGGGVLLQYLHQQNCSITACENQHITLLKNVCQQLSIPATFCEDVFMLNDSQYDFIFALDVLEHMGDVNRITEKLISLLKPRGELVLSGPTENVLYKIGRRLAGFSGYYHVRNIYQIEQILDRKGLERRKLKTLYWFLPLFRISVWRTNALVDRHKKSIGAQRI